MYVYIYIYIYTCIHITPSCASSSLSSLTHLRKLAPRLTHIEPSPTLFPGPKQCIDLVTIKEPQEYCPDGTVTHLNYDRLL